jgi:hypothetical protein
MISTGGTGPAAMSSSFGSTSNLAAALNSAVTVSTVGMGSIGFYLTIPTGATVIFESSADGGTTYSTCTLRAQGSDGYATTGTISGGYIGSVSNTTHFRARVSVAGSAAGSVIGTLSAAINTLEGIENPPPSDFSINVARGRIQNMFTVNKFGRNPDIDIGTEDCWSQGGTWVGPTAARVHALVSSSAADASGGTGARTVTVYGLDSAYAQTQETVTLNGVTPVNTSGSYIMIHRMLVETAGSGMINAGTITATAAVDGTITIAIIADKGQSQLGLYMVPAGYTAYCLSWRVDINGGTNARLAAELMAKPFGGAWNLKSTIDLQIGSSSGHNESFDPPMRLCTEKGLIRLRGTADTNNTSMNGHFDLIVVAN